MSTQGIAVVNFGSGTLEATITVTGQSGLSTSNLVEAWATCNETVGSATDDSAWVEQIQVFATYLIGGTGFTIIAKPMMGKAFGSYNVSWVWN